MYATISLGVRARLPPINLPTKTHRAYTNSSLVLGKLWSPTHILHSLRPRVLWVTWMLLLPRVLMIARVRLLVLLRVLSTRVLLLTRVLVLCILLLPKHTLSPLGLILHWNIARWRSRVHHTASSGSSC